MTSKTRTIELDDITATALKERADARGLTVPELVTEYLDEDQGSSDVDADQIAELDRRWAAVEARQPTAPNDQVVRWLETWGTPAYKPWQSQ